MENKQTITGFIKANLLKWLGWVLFFLLLWFQGCRNKNEPTIQIDKKGSFKTDTIIQHKTLPGKTITVKGKEVIVYKNNEINKELALENYNLQIAYINTKDSLEKEKLYKTAIELKSFNQPFENYNFKANVSGIVQGEVKSMKLDYELKKLPIKETKFRLLLGGGAGIDKDLQQGLYKFNVGYQNTKGNIVRGSYMKIGNESYGMVEYDFSLFKITK